jgi:outer membrane lipopolysaccharide assembly protein LptE/RlpB
MKFKRSKSVPAKNSEEYLTYVLKQSRKSASEITSEIRSEIANFTRNFVNKCQKFVAKNTGKDVWRQDIYKLSNRELVEQLNEAQKKEIKEPLEKIIKYIEKLPDSEPNKASQLKEYKELLDLLTKKAS